MFLTLNCRAFIIVVFDKFLRFFFNQLLSKACYLYFRKLFEITRKIFIVKIRNSLSNLQFALYLLYSNFVIDIKACCLHFRKLIKIIQEISIVKIRKSLFNLQLAFLVLFQKKIDLIISTNISSKYYLLYSKLLFRIFCRAYWLDYFYNFFYRFFE